MSSHDATGSPSPGRARKAVIPAAGLGTRFLPATKAIPKELLPIIDTPALEFIVAEASSFPLPDEVHAGQVGGSLHQSEPSRVALLFQRRFDLGG